MQEQEPSRTAFAAAWHRAAHQLLEGGRIFADPFAVPVLGLPEDEVIARAEARPMAAGMRAFIAARTAFAESALKAGVEERGVSQLVVLGAGLDTFAYRNPFGDRLRVFEVDHPATQAWKRRRLGEAGIAVPDSLIYAPVDFERDSLASGLEATGFDARQRTFFTWLGVVPYLTREAITATLRFIATLPGGGEVVFDYGDPPATLPPEQRAGQAERAAAVAAEGEPFLSYFEAEPLAAELQILGFTQIEDLSPQGWVARFFGPEVLAHIQARGGPDRGGHLIRAATA